MLLAITRRCHMTLKHPISSLLPMMPFLQSLLHCSTQTWGGPGIRFGSTLGVGERCPLSHPWHSAPAPEWRCYSCEEKRSTRFFERRGGPKSLHSIMNSYFVHPGKLDYNGGLNQDDTGSLPYVHVSSFNKLITAQGCTL